MLGGLEECGKSLIVRAVTINSWGGEVMAKGEGDDTVPLLYLLFFVCVGTLQKLNDQLEAAYDKLASDEKPPKETELAQFYSEKLRLMVPGKEAITENAVDGMTIIMHCHNLLDQKLLAAARQ